MSEFFYTLGQDLRQTKDKIQQFLFYFSVIYQDMVLLAKIKYPHKFNFFNSIRSVKLLIIL